MDVQQLKLLAGRIRGLLEQSDISITHNQALDTSAALVGLRNWPEVQAFADHVEGAKLDLAATSRLAYRLKTRHGLEVDHQHLLSALRPPAEADHAVLPHIWPSGPPAGVYVTTERAHITALVAAYTEASDGALVYGEMTEGDAPCIDLGEYGLWSTGLDHVPSGSLLLVGPIELNQQAWSQSADRIEMACYRATNSGHRVAVLVATETPGTLFHDLQLMVRNKQPAGDDLHEQIMGEVAANGELVRVEVFPAIEFPQPAVVAGSLDAIPPLARGLLQQTLNERRSGLLLVGSSDIQEHWAIDLVDAALAMASFAGPAVRIKPRSRSTPAKDWQVPDAIKALPFLPSVESAYSLGYRRMIVTPGYTSAELFSRYGSEVLFIAGGYGGAADDIFFELSRSGGRDAQLHALKHLIAVLGVTSVRTPRRQADLVDLYVHDGWQPTDAAGSFSLIQDRLRNARKLCAEHQLAQILEAGEIGASTVKKALPRERWLTEFLASWSKTAPTARQRREDRIDQQIAFYERMVELGGSMTEEEALALSEWERAHVTGDGSFATSDWPGWQEVFKRLQH